MVSEKVLTGAAARRERSRTEMRTAILAEARRIVSESGVDALSMRAIARSLGYSPGALYEYYRDKEAIVSGLYFEGAGGLGDRLELSLATMPDDAGPVERICILGRAYRAFALENAELYRLTFRALPYCFAPGEQPEESMGGFDVLVAALREGVELGVIVEESPEALALMCWAGVHGFVSLELSGHLNTGGEPGSPRSSQQEEEQRGMRDALFERMTASLMFGLVREDRRAAHGAGAPPEATPPGVPGS